MTLAPNRGDRCFGEDLTTPTSNGVGERRGERAEPRPWRLENRSGGGGRAATTTGRQKNTSSVRELGELGTVAKLKLVVSAA